MALGLRAAEAGRRDVGVGASAFTARLRDIPRVTLLLFGSGAAASADVEGGCSDSLFQPLSTPRESVGVSVPLSASLLPRAGSTLSAGDDVDLVSAGGCRWWWV